MVALPFSSLRHATMSFLGCRLAKLLAVSNPMPVFAPVIMTTLLDNSDFSEGGRRVHCSDKDPHNVNGAMAVYVWEVGCGIEA